MQRYFAKEKVNDSFILMAGDIHHIKNVMRNKIDDLIEVVFDNNLYICKIIDIDDLKLEIVDKIPENNEMSINLTVAVSLVNEQKFDLILQKLTELGVSNIIPVKTERSIIKLDDKRITKKIERWQTICKEASEQSKRTKIPKVENVMTIKEISNLNKELKLICSLNEKTKSINYYLKDNIKEILFIIGPEGGFTEKEESVLLNNKFLPVSLGKRVMRVETAAIYAASIINYIYEG